MIRTIPKYTASLKTPIEKLRVKTLLLYLVVIGAIIALANFAIVEVAEYQASRLVYSALHDVVNRAIEKPPVAPAEENLRHQNVPFYLGQIEGDSYYIGNEDNSERFPIAVYEVNTQLEINLISSEATATLSGDRLMAVMAEIRDFEEDEGYLERYNLFYARQLLEDRAVVAFSTGNAAKMFAPFETVFSTVGAALFLLLSVFGVVLINYIFRPTKKLWELQERFIADASHELKSPLSIIVANSDILLNNPQKTVDEQRQWIEGIRDEAIDMLDVTQDMLQLASLDDSRGKKLETATVSLSEVVERAVLQFEGTAFERGVALKSNIEQAVSVEGVYSQLNQLVNTLIDNACKYADEGTTVTVTLCCEGANALFAVHNWGNAIDEKDLPFLFERFYRTDVSRHRSENGVQSFGLGLAIARSIVENHHGDITVSSSQSEGTTFTVTLPH